MYLDPISMCVGFGTGIAFTLLMIWLIFRTPPADYDAVP